MEGQKGRTTEDLERAGQALVASGTIGRELTPNAVDARISMIGATRPDAVEALGLVANLVDESLAAGEQPESVALRAHSLLDDLTRGN